MNFPKLPAGVQDMQFSLHAAPSSQSPVPPAVNSNPPLTKTGNFNGPGLDLGTGRAPGELGKPVAAVIRVTALNLASSDETYTFQLQQSPDNSTWVNIGGSVAATATGAISANGLLTEEYVRLTLTVAGTSPSITYEAYLNPNTGAI